MIIKRFKLFESSVDIIGEIEDIFIDIIDLKHDTYQIRNGDGTEYNKVHDIDFKISKKDNIVVNILCSFHYHYGIANDIRKEVLPRLESLGYKSTIRIKKTDNYVYYNIPNSSGGLSSVRDNIYLISVIIDVNN
jgi:hypothetical protein